MLSYVEILLQTLKRNKLNSTQFKIFVDYTSLNAICTLRSKLKKCFRTNQKIKHPDSVGLHFCSEILNHKIVYKEIYADFKYDISDHFPIFIEIVTFILPALL